MKIGDIINKNGNDYVVIEVKQRIVKVRRLIEGSRVGHEVLSFPKQTKIKKVKVKETNQFNQALKIFR